MFQMPPGGSSINLREILNSYSKSVDLNSLGLNYNFFLLKSGKDALYEAYKASEFREMSLPAYSCPDAVTPALKAGIKVNLVDIEPTSLLPKEKCDVLINLYGLVDPLSPDATIDDACQGALSFERGERLGLRGLTFGVFSAGRGKALGAGGGGILAARQNSLYDEKLTHLKPETSLSASSLLAAIMAFGYSALEHEAVFGLLSKIPQLKIGQTVVNKSFEQGSPSEVQKAWLAMKLQNLPSTTFSYTDALSSLSDLTLPVLTRPGENSLTRYPVLFPTAAIREKVYKNTSQLGASKSYPDILCHLDGLGKLGKKEDYPGAKEVSEQILTFPTHRRVNEKHVSKIAEEIKKCL